MSTDKRDLPATVPSTMGDDGEGDSLLREIAAAPSVDVPVELAALVSIEPGTIIDGKFKLEERLGAGGMGVVYAAVDLSLGREVAIKLMRLERSVGGVRDRLPAVFDREARATARLNHPNIVTLHQFGDWNGILYLVLERLRGEPLSARLERGPLPLLEALTIMEQVAAALVHTHAAGVIHRDLKPANVFLLADGGVKVLDFGVSGLGLVAVTAPTAQDTAPPRMTLAHAGTPGYMAPEQWAGEPQDARTDLWAFGVMLYQLVTNKLPFAANEPPHAVEMTPLATRLPPEASELVDLLTTCLTLPRDERAIDAGQAVATVHRVRTRLDPTLARAVEPRSRTARLVRAGVGVTAAAAVAITAVALWPTAQQSACDGAERHLAGTWDAPTRDRLHSVFAQAGPHGESTWTAFATTLDRYSREWVAMHEQACRAGGERAPLVARCLDERRGQLTRVVRDQETVHAETIVSTLSAAYALAPIADCADAAYIARFAPGAGTPITSSDGLVRAAVTVSGPGVEVVHAVMPVANGFVLSGSATTESTIVTQRVPKPGNFLTRLAQDGTLHWFDASPTARVIALAEGTAGDVFVAGWYTGATSLAGIALPAPAGGGDCFVGSVATDTGRAHWLIPCGATHEGEIRTAASDREGNLYVAGDFGGDARFGGSRTIDADARPTMVPFVASWSPTGALRWVTTGRGIGFARSKGIAVDGDAVILGTRVTGGGWLGDHELRRGGCVVARLDTATGAIRWLRELDLVKCELDGVAVSGTRVAAAGRHRGLGAWIEELDAATGRDRWRARLGTHDQEGIRSAVYSGDTLTVLGYFGASITIGDQMLHGNGDRETFIASFDATGRVIGALAFGGARDERSRWIGASPRGTVFVTGRFDSTMTLGTRELRAEGRSDGHLLELALPWLQK